MSDKTVLATVGKKEITSDDVEFLLKSMNPRNAAQFNSEEGKKEVLKELINQELFLLDAQDSGIESDEIFLREFDKVKSNFLKQYAINKLIEGIKVDEAELKNFYEANKKHFVNQESVKASHILVDTEDKANEVLKEIEDGLSFEAAAEKYSSCPSSSNGGDLGYFTRGQMVPEFENAAFNMNPGETSKPVKTQFGYHLIKLSDKKSGSVKPFEEVHDQLSKQLLSMKQQDAYYGKVEELKKKYEVKMNA